MLVLAAVATPSPTPHAEFPAHLDPVLSPILGLIAVAAVLTLLFAARPRRRHR